MALSKSVSDSLREAEGNLRNALAYAARQERPLVCTSIAKLIQEMESIQTFDPTCLSKLKPYKYYRLICCHLIGTPSSLYLFDSSRNFSYSVFDE